MALLIATQFASTQTANNKIALGLNVARTEYIGDYGNGLFNFSQAMYPAGGLSLAFYLSPSFDIGLQGMYGSYGFFQSNVNLFEGIKIDGSLFGRYKLNNGYIFKENSKWSPFISLGVGIAGYTIDSRIDKSGTNPSLDPLIITDGIDLVVPVGIGLKYQINDNFGIQYQYVYNYTNNDVHDQNRSGGVENIVFNTPAHPAYRKGYDAYGEHIFSFVFSFGKAKDSDNDGIADKYDICPETPVNVVVDKSGCPVDTDGDGVADYLDQCADTPAGANVDSKGCPTDVDKDGIFDYLDKCPNTPKGVNVDEQGCPRDLDGDGVADYLDKCPNTPAGVKVDAAGCSLDTDGDGVADYLDKCPDTPAGSKVDATGCVLKFDADGDGIADEFDKCSNTPKNILVDANGCPLDTDGDGVADYLDKCPKTAGLLKNDGCPEVKEEAKTLFKKALQGIQFESGKANIKPFSFPLLNQIANVLILNPTYLIEVQGHTDNVGGYDYNIGLSQSRAAAVRTYLIENGVTENRITSQGYGYNKPVASNKTSAGKAKNRRVEFVVTFEE